MPTEDDTSTSSGDAGGGRDGENCIGSDSDSDASSHDRRDDEDMDDGRTSAAAAAAAATGAPSAHGHGTDSPTAAAAAAEAAAAVADDGRAASASIGPSGDTSTSPEDLRAIQNLILQDILHARRLGKVSEAASDASSSSADGADVNGDGGRAEEEEEEKVEIEEEGSPESVTEDRSERTVPTRQMQTQTQTQDDDEEEDDDDDEVEEEEEGEEQIGSTEEQDDSREESFHNDDDDSRSNDQGVAGRGGRGQIGSSGEEDEAAVIKRFFANIRSAIGMIGRPGAPGMPGTPDTGNRSRARRQRMRESQEDSQTLPTHNSSNNEGGSHGSGMRLDTSNNEEDSHGSGMRLGDVDVDDESGAQQVQQDSHGSGMELGDVDVDDESGAQQVQPGAFYVQERATTSRRPARRRRGRRFRRARDRDQSGERDLIDGIENALADMGEFRREEESTPSPRVLEATVEITEPASSGFTHVSATAVDDVVVEASIVKHEAVGCSRRKVALVATAVVLALGVVLGVSISLSRRSALKPSKAPTASVEDEDELPEYGEICNSDPANCGCYIQAINDRPAVILQADYRGTINVTGSGKTCQAWDSQSPHEHNLADWKMHPELEVNYCRNPDSSGGAWCYTTDPDTRWEYCDVPECSTTLVPITLSPVQAPVPVPERSSCVDSEQQVRPTSGLNFNGNTNYVTIPNSTSSGLSFDGPFTIQVWIKPKKKVDFITIISNKEGGSENVGFSFTINGWSNSNGKLGLEGTYSKMYSTVSVTWDEWQHVAVAYDGNKPAFYLDGNQVPHRQEDFFDDSFQILPSTFDANIGDFAYYNGNAFFSGTMDDLRVYGHARSAKNVRDDMDCEVDDADPGLIALYRFDEGDDRRTVYDSSPNANHGRMVDYGDDASGFVDDGVALCTNCRQ